MTKLLNAVELLTQTCKNARTDLLQTNQPTKLSSSYSISRKHNPRIKATSPSTNQQLSNQRNNHPTNQRQPDTNSNPGHLITIPPRTIAVVLLGQAHVRLADFLKLGCCLRIVLKNGSEGDIENSSEHDPRVRHERRCFIGAMSMQRAHAWGRVLGRDGRGRYAQRRPEGGACFRAGRKKTRCHTEPEEKKRDSTYPI